ncbi:MAG: DUF484 family protein, partial [Thioalkalispiraceae bacterium]
HRDLLADMVLPHESGEAVSLIERQVSILREQKDEHKQKLQQLIQNAQQNEQLVNKLNKLILDMMDTTSLEQLVRLVQKRLVSDFNADEVSVRFVDGKVKSDHASLLDNQGRAAFDGVIEKCKPVCGRLTTEQMQVLFNDAAESIKSAALMPLLTNKGNKECLGLVAIGSKDVTRFSADMDTLFLDHLAMVLTRMINQHF